MEYLGCMIILKCFENTILGMEEHKTDLILKRHIQNITSKGKCISCTCASVDVKLAIADNQVSFVQGFCLSLGTWNQLCADLQILSETKLCSLSAVLETMRLRVGAAILRNQSPRMRVRMSLRTEEELRIMMLEETSPKLLDLLIP